MTKEEFIAKLQMVYVGDKNAFDELVSAYSDQQQRIDKAIKKLYAWGEELDPVFQSEMLLILKDEEVKDNV